MIKALLATWLVMAVAIGLAAVEPSVDIDEGFFSILGVAIVLGLVNALVGPVLRIVSAPLTLVTLGLCALVVNGILRALTAGPNDSLDVGGFLGTVAAAVLISIFAPLLHLVVGRRAEA